MLALRRSVLTAKSLKYFQKTGPKKAKCTLCEKTYAFHGGTSNLCDHLHRLHASDFKLKQQPRFDDFVIRGKCPDSRAKRITELIADLAARDLRPALWWKETDLKHF